MSDQTDNLLREIRDLLVAHEERYADHLKKLQAMYETQTALARRERERSINRLSIAGGIIGLIAYVLYKWG